MDPVIARAILDIQKRSRLADALDEEIAFVKAELSDLKSKLRKLIKRRNALDKQ